MLQIKNYLGYQEPKNRSGLPSSIPSTSGEEKEVANLIVKHQKFLKLNTNLTTNINHYILPLYVSNYYEYKYYPETRRNLPTWAIGSINFFLDYEKIRDIPYEELAELTHIYDCAESTCEHLDIFVRESDKKWTYGTPALLL